MSNNNPSGKNGYGAKNCTSESPQNLNVTDANVSVDQDPPDDVLKEALLQYARESERLSVDQKLVRLKVEHQLDIRPTKLWQLEKKFEVPSARRPPAPEAATAAVLAIVEADVNQQRGTGSIGTILANQLILIPRDWIRKILATHAPEGLNRRFPGVRAIKRSALDALGPHHQYHADGHEKLNAQALQMGGSLTTDLARLSGMYTWIWSRVTNIEFPLTMVHRTKGSEVGYLFGFQTGLREVYAPEEDVTKFPPVVQMKSVHNTPIEGLWHWFSQTHGRNIKDDIISGYRTGIYNPNNPVHPKLFNWIWPKALQIQLDLFRQYWNNHKIRTQKAKPNQSGSTPRHAFIAPDLSQVQDCHLKVEEVVVDALRGRIPVSRQDAMRFVDAAFDALAKEAYEAIGSPDLSDTSRIWDIFRAMLIHIPLND
ncbi:hypothetical protein NMY22_g16464 [Coprinellus aureogranulatus]|nr:hypothetical protein NMY22_g16464 [Coprinellus aureogranulatus]